MPTNWYMFLVSALIPLAVGFIYYHKAVFGKAWMNVNGFTDESMEGANMGVIFAATFFLGCLFSFFLSSLVIHQGGVFSMLAPEVMTSGSAEQIFFNETMAKYGHTGRSFFHGAIHGIMTSVFFVLPIIAINALFERRGWKYIFLHFGYWLICLILMGGLICSTLKYAPLS